MGMMAIQKPDTLGTIAQGIADGRLVPYLGPELSAGGTAPADLGALAVAINAKVAVPGRIRGNPWAAAQYVETHRHRVTLRRVMEDIFAAAAEPGALHRALAAVAPPLVVELWYGDAMARALEQTRPPVDWVQIQGVSRAEYADDWWQAFDPDGNRVRARAALAGPRTLLYKPWGAAWPIGSFLVSDADFVEVLTEIDIQTPIPDEVQARRADRGFVFVGSRFDDQTARQFARQIVKRSSGPRYLLARRALSDNEARFCQSEDISVIDAGPDDLAARLS